MDGRQARGRVLAQAQGDRIKHIEGALWFVPSSQSTGGYLVDMSVGRCSCPDDAERCKHVVAVEIVRAALVQTNAPVLTASATPPPGPAPVKAPPPRGDLTKDEQARVRAALKFLTKGRLGGWQVLSKATRYTVKSLKNVAYGHLATASIAVRLARFVGVGVDDILTGRYPPRCPTCGQVAKEVQLDPRPELSSVI